tara:strand:+ start:1048 stop:1215 length:168 start_codon:yes stop_codon:yes gene_type:complete
MHESLAALVPGCPVTTLLDHIMRLPFLARVFAAATATVIVVFTALAFSVCSVTET